ncbi:hypothetical protein BKI52_06555 [marine bacterium AO1-C]|nr:hypothetical protein BKI52_06555 [marine bacterium AO1-C]
MRIYLFILAVLLLASCSESQKPSHIVVEENGNKYLFSQMGEKIVSMSIAKGEAPMVIKATRIIPDGSDIFITMGELYKIANLIGGNYKTFDKKEKSFVGYVVVGNTPVVQTKTLTEAGEKIGDTESIIQYTITDPKTQKQLNIKYASSPKVRAVENCEKKSLTVPVNNKSNEFTSQKHIVVRLSTLTNFFARKCEASYNKGEGILYLKFAK